MSSILLRMPETAEGKMLTFFPKCVKEGRVEEYSHSIVYKKRRPAKPRKLFAYHPAIIFYFSKVIMSRIRHDIPT